ncbi:MAG: biotin--[acetyl-CoA-carboxylase] ligase [Nocardioidaceae bacterium]
MDSPYSDLDRPPLDVAALNRALTAPDSWWRDVVVVTETESTNTDLAERARRGAEAGTVLVAEHQTGGRGRLDREWTSPPRSGLTMSLLVDPLDVPADRWPWITLLAGLAVAEGVRRTTDVAATLKWPNDLIVEDRKLAGILTERVETPTGSKVVVGIGVNATLREDERPTDEATSLLLEGARTTDRTVVLREVLRVFEQLFRAWVAGAGDPALGIAESYERRCSTLGRRVRVLLPTGVTVAGRAVRLDGDGRLVVRTDHGEETVSAGDVVHVR